MYLEESLKSQNIVKILKSIVRYPTMGREHKVRSEIIYEAINAIEQLLDALRWAAPYVKDDPRVSAIIKSALKEVK